jgi:hypothetical protein
VLAHVLVGAPVELAPAEMEGAAVDAAQAQEPARK